MGNKNLTNLEIIKKIFRRDLYIGLFMATELTIILLK